MTIGDSPRPLQSTGPATGQPPPALDRRQNRVTALAPKPTVSVVMPFYNEAASVPHTLAAVWRWLASAPDYEFIFVDDGSTDTTRPDLLRALGRRPDPRLKLVPCPVNAGKGAAMRTGLHYCRGPAVVFTDGDLAYSLDHLPAMEAALARHEVVIGSRKLAGGRLDAETAALRRLLGEGFNRLMRLMIGLPYPDTQAGLKAFRRDVAQTLFPRLRTAGYAVDVELLYLANRQGLRIAQVPARVSRRHKAKRSSVNLWRDPLRMTRDMARIRLAGWRGLYD
jgi:glycosyltransferase involved in cell wall biosynthesis